MPHIQPQQPPQPPMELVPLGTNGFFPALGRHTMAYLLLVGDQAVLLDAGTGVGRLAEPALAERLAGYPRLDVVLTHYHLDHVVGLSYLLGVWRDRPIHIFAPQAPLVDAPDAHAALGQLLSPPLFPLELDRFPQPVEVVPYGADGDTASLRVGALELALRRQSHPGGSVGLRLGDRLAYITDTVADPATADFVAGVDLLMHEVWLTAAEGVDTDAGATGHSDAGAVAEIARRAGVGRLMPVHHRPDRSPADLERLVGDLRAAGLAAVLPEEGVPVLV